jgi:hypothetical protein
VELVGFGCAGLLEPCGDAPERGAEVSLALRMRLGVRGLRPVALEHVMHALIESDGAPVRPNRLVGDGQRVRHRALDEAELTELCLQASKDGDETAARVVRHQITDLGVPAGRAEEAGTVHGMETRVPERGGVSDVVEPCCDHQETRLPVSYGAGESSGPPGHGGAVVDPLRVATEKPKRQLPGPREGPHADVAPGGPARAPSCLHLVNVCRTLPPRLVNTR